LSSPGYFATPHRDEQAPRPEPAADGLQTHFLLFLILMSVAILVSGVLFSLKSRADKTFENAVQQDLRLSTDVPKLRAQIRQIDLLSAVNHETNDPIWLAKRGRRILRLKDLALVLVPGPYSHEINGLLSQLQDELSLFLRDQDSDTRKAPHKDVYETLDAVASAAVLELEVSIASAHRTAFQRMLARLGIELLMALLLAWYLYYFMVAPILEIERGAKDWKVGQPWSLRPLHAIPELRSLLSLVLKSTSDANARFREEQKLNEFKTKMVSLVTHEFANGLAVIHNAAFLLEELSSPQELESEKGEFITMISRTERGMSREVHNLLNMSRLEAGMLAIHFTKTPAEEILREVVKRLALLAEIKALNVRLEIAAGLLPVAADSSTLSLAISNLVSNAIKYTPDKGRIDIGIQREPGKRDLYRFYVRDNGIGISAADHVKVLSGYFRTESGRKMSKGFGIGLSLAKEILEAHGSSLELESSPGKGSRFSFLLPVWRQERESEPQFLSGRDGAPALSSK
jgi:signal transduction histidine kinase